MTRIVNNAESPFTYKPILEALAPLPTGLYLVQSEHNSVYMAGWSATDKALYVWAAIEEDTLSDFFDTVVNADRKFVIIRELNLT